MSELRLFLPIRKIDESQRLVYGTLTAEVPDKAGEIFDYSSGKPAVKAWSDEIHEASGGKSKGNVRAMHGKTAAGKFTDIVFDDEKKRIEGAAKIIDDDEWQKVVEGVYTGFSIGGSYTKRWQDKDNPSLWRFTPELTEISLVDNPCVPTATFEYIKADGSREMRKFTPSHKEDSMDPKLLKAAQDAEAAGNATDEQKALLAKAADAAKVALVKDGKAVKPKAAPVQKWMADDGSAFDSRREAEVHNLHLEKQIELAPGIAQMDALLKGAKKPEEEENDEDKDGDDEETKAKKKERREKKAKENGEKEETEAAAKKKKEEEEAEKARKEKEEADKAAADALGKKDYSEKERKEMAGKEAMDDGSFPIKTKKDVEDAVRDWGRAGSKPEVKAHIIARAKAIGAEDTLPDDWTGKKKDKKEKSAPKGALEKGLHQVGWLAHLLDDLQCLQNSVTIEQYFEDDKDSELPAKFKSLVAEMCEVLVTLVQEETEELTEGDDTDVQVLEMAAGLPVGHPEAVAKFARANAEPLVKSDSKAKSATGAKLIKFAETMEKAGARHSKADADRVQALHDHAEEMHKCMGDMAEKCADMHKVAAEAKNTAIDLGAKGDKVDDQEDVEPANKAAVKMSKLYEQLNAKTDEVLAVSKVAAASNEILLKAIPLIEGLQGTVSKLEQEKSDLVKRMEHLEKQPAAPKGHVRTVSKTQDSGGAAGETDAEYRARLAKMNAMERSRELMKLAMANPQEMPTR